MRHLLSTFTLLLILAVSCAPPPRSEPQTSFIATSTDSPTPTLFEQMNEYLRKEAPSDIENPTVEGIAERLGIPGDVLRNWLYNDEQFRKEMTRLKEFHEKDPFKEGTDFDYFIHSSGVQFILDETKKRYGLDISSKT